MKATTAIVFVLGSALAGCAESPATLRIVSGPPEANQDVAALLVDASSAVDAPVRLIGGARVASSEAALAALEDGTADVAIVENYASIRHASVRTVAPLYPSVLHIGVRPEQRGRRLREVLAGATVYAGVEDAPARRLLDRMASMYAWSDVQFSYVDSLERDPDVVFGFSPISPSDAPQLAGYELLSLGRAEDVGHGSPADGLSLVAPYLRSFVIPEATYGSLTPTAIATVAGDRLLVTRADTPRVVIFDLLQTIQMAGPLLVAQRPDLGVEELESFDIGHLTFPLHPGAQAFRARNEPGFVERAAGLIDAVLAAVAALGTGLFAALQYWRSRKKTRIDAFYAEALAIRAKLSPELTPEQRSLLAAQLRALRDRAFSLLMDEKLAADDSFRILQSLASDVIHELETLGRVDAGRADPSS